MVRCHGEVFGGNLTTLAAYGSRALDDCLFERDSNPVKFLSERVYAPLQAQAVGFKILYQQILQQWPGLLEALRDDKDIQVIHLIRKNGVKRFLSEYVVGTITFQHLCRADQHPPHVEPFSVPVDDLLRDLEKTSLQEREVSETLARPNFLKVAYEDTLDTDSKTVLELQSFIGVAPACLSAPIRKILPDELQRIISNFDEVERALRGTPFEVMLSN